MKRLLALVCLTLVTLACDNQDKAQQTAATKAWNREYFIPVNDVEYKNYERRQKLADDPSAIIWCTSAFPIPSSPLFTVPIVGKITSGSKRPFNNDPGPDSMYGSSGEYRYGFTPAGMYADWTNMPVFCTQEPTVWQREQSTIVMMEDPQLATANRAAKEALKAGKTDEAYQILSKAITSIR